jgi:dephospho-CoA kinase
MEELKKKSLDVNEYNERMIRESLRKEFGMGAMAIKSLDKIRDTYEKENVVIESLYSWDEYKIIRDEFSDAFKLVTIFTHKSLRYKRLAERLVRPLTEAEATSRDISEIENLDKGGPIAFTDFLVINDGTLNELESNLIKIL